jgi:hypothetical protein
MVSIKKNTNSFASFPQYLLTVLAVAGTFLILGWLFKYSAYGFDFTDESFYLVWIANPFIYDGSITQFGFVYYPLYRLLGGDIAALRQANILLTFGLAWSLTYFFLASIAVDLIKSRITLLTISASLATSALIIFSSWLATPSYNSLALQALLISATGLILVDKSFHRKSIIGWLLIGIGGWLAFMAKPTTALALAVGVLIYLPLARKFSLQMLALTVGSTILLLLISALLIDGSTLGFLKRLQLGVEFSQYLGGGHTLEKMLRIDTFQLDSKTKLGLRLVFFLVLIALWGAWAKNKQWLFVTAPISIAFFALTAMLTFGQIHKTAGLGQFQGLLIFALVYAATVAALILGRLKGLKKISVSQWALAALFLTMPHMYAFGTNNNYWQAGSLAAIFWLLAGLTLLGPLIRERASWLLLLPLALAAQAVTATLLQTGLEQPYRQTQPLRLNASTLEIGSQGAELILSKGYAEYIAKAKSTIRESGFESKTPIIDLTGQSPGILYSIGAESIGQAWTIGGYPGSLKLAEAAFIRITCEKISKAWVLFEQGGPRSISNELMHSLGADFPINYELVGKWQTAEGAGGYPARRTQELYKPLKHSETLNICMRLRNSQG